MPNSLSLCLHGQANEGVNGAQCIELPEEEAGKKNEPLTQEAESP